MNDARRDNLSVEIAALPDMLHGPVERWRERLFDAGVTGAILPGATREARWTLVRLIATSEFAGGVLVRNWDWFNAAHSAGELDKPLDSTALAGFANSVRDVGDDVATIQSRLRRYRNQCLVHILWRVLGDQDDIWDSLRALSDLADALITASMRSAEGLLTPRFGRPLDRDGQLVAGVVLETCWCYTSTTSPTPVSFTGPLAAGCHYQMQSLGKQAYAIKGVADRAPSLNDMV